MAKKPLELESLKWPFVGLSVLLALSAGWAVYDEVFARRPWKDYQRDFYKLEAKHLKDDLERVEKRLSEPAAKQQRDAAVAELKAANDAISGDAAQRKGYEDAVRAEDKAKIAEDDAKLDLGFAKSEADAIYYLLRDARHHGYKAEEAKQQKEMDKWEAEIKKRDEVYQAAIKRRQETSKAKNTFLIRREAAAAALEKIDKPAIALRERIKVAESKWPELDQYWIEGLKNSWEGPTVDRCQNCHVGVNKGGFSAPWEVLRAKRQKMPANDFKVQFGVDDEVVEKYEAVYDKFCERLPEEPVAMPIGGFRAPADPALRTERKTDDVCKKPKEYERLVSVSEAYCGKTGRWLPKTKAAFIDKAGVVLTGEAARKFEWACYEKDVAAQFDEGLKVDVFDVKPVFRTHPARFQLLVKAHPPEQFGCTTCHGGEGAQTKGVMHHAFKHGKDDHHWNDPLTEEITVLGEKYKGAFLQAKCDKCHTQELNVQHAPLLAKGKKLFTDVGCWGCHPSEGYNELPKRGPTLTNINSKSDPGWLASWIAWPKGFRPHTRMPNFWPGAVDAKSVPASIDADGKPRGSLTEDKILASHRALREDEVRAITAYIVVNSETSKLEKAPTGGDAKKGKELFDDVGCRACHVADLKDATRRSEASTERDYAPNLFNIADKTNADWIYTWIRNPKALWPQTKMPDLRLTAQEAADVTAYLMTLKTGTRYPADPIFAATADKAKLHQIAAKGKEAISKYGCFGCHDVKGFENAQKIGTELSDHGRKDAHLLDFGDVKYFTENPKQRETYANWVWVKLATPRIYAYERVETRMPQFDFTDDEKLALLTFLKSQTGEKPPAQYLTANDPNRAAVYAGEKLVYWNGCRNCHIVEKRGGTIRDRFNEDDQSFAPPVLNGQGWKTQPPWLFSFLKDPVGEASAGTNLRPWVKVRMPTFHFNDEDATNLVKYFSAAAGKSFPYLTPREGPKPDAARLKEADALFNELKCMSCHVVGPLRPGQDPGSAAPNLALSKTRLRPDWIPAWLINPQALMDGTRMPSFWDFTDPKKPTAPSKTFHGNGKDQVEALRDLLMYLGETPGNGKRAEAEPPKKGRRG